MDFLGYRDYSNLIIKQIHQIKNILKDYEEKLLVIYYKDEKGAECVKYDNHNLLLYEYDTTESKSDENQISIKYNPGNYLDFSFDDFEGNIIDYPNSKNTITRFKDIINKIYQLKHVNAVKLDMDSKTLIEIYKLFYNENPDFSKKNINIRVQTMMSILEEFGFSLGDNYTFNLLGKSKLPISLNLEQKVNKLFPLGEVIDVDEPITLAEEPKRTIKIIGDCIREVISDDCNKDKILITISKIIYARRYVLSSNTDIKKLSEFTNHTPNEVESSIRLVKRIEKRSLKKIHNVKKILAKFN